MTYRKNSSFTKALERGFTLIELLVVIAIIGILATIVLSSLGSARQKATDAKAQAQLSSMRSQAQLFYNTNGNYGTPLTDFSGGCSSGVATASGTLFADDSGANLTLYHLLQNLPTGYTANCYTTPGGSGGLVGDATDWAVTATNNKNASWCVDSSGQSKYYGVIDPGVDTTATPIVCP